MSTGMTWQQCREELDLPSLDALRRYWEHSPPVHKMVAAYFGIGKKPSEVNENGDSLLDLFPRAQDDR